MKKKLLCIALAFVFTVGLGLTAQAEDLALPAPSCILMEKDTRQILYEENAHEKLRPASVTKIMTLLLVMEALDNGSIGWDDTVTTSAAAAAKGGSQIYLEENEQLPLTEMLKSVVVSSANDCACALAEHVAGSEAAFVSRMNDRAAELGMTDTHFVNCTGLDDGPDADTHLTTAYDIALMSRALLQHDEIKQYTTIWMDTVRDGTFGLSNTNKLIRFYSGATGLKTGFTSGAGYCLSASAMRDGMELIAVVMKGETADKRNTDAKALLNYGFSAYALVSAAPEEPLPALPVTMGEVDTVALMLPPDALTAVVEKAQAAALERRIDLPESLPAPVRQGQQVGTLTLCSGDTELMTVPILAAEDAAGRSWGRMFTDLLKMAVFAG